MSDLQVANTILAQLGGPMFRMMVGAKDVVGSSDSLMFGLKNGHANRNGINKVCIKLEPQDTYTVTFYRIREMKAKVVSEHKDVYCDQLQDLFEKETGLYVTLYPRKS